MPKRRRCPICNEDFPERSYYRRCDQYFDPGSNSWRDHGENAASAEAEDEYEKQMRNLIDDLKKSAGIHQFPY